MGHKNWPAELGLVVLIVVATVFAFTPLVSAQTYTDLDNFAGSSAGDGAKPADGFIQDGSLLYGTTRRGGTNSLGTIFSFNPATGVEQNLCSFAGGTTDGASPTAALTADGAMLYGVTSAGGASGARTIFSFNTATGVETPLHSFAGSAGGDGATPFASLLLSGNNLYGTTSAGGNSSSGGAVFAYNLSTQSESVLYKFGTNAPTAPGLSDGSGPNGALTQVGSVLYGTTVMGGASEGTLFSLNTQNNQESVVYNFGTTVSNDDGILPRGALLQVGSVFYGTTSANEIGNGSLFSYDL